MAQESQQTERVRAMKTMRRVKDIEMALIMTVVDILGLTSPMIIQQSVKKKKKILP